MVMVDEAVVPPAKVSAGGLTPRHVRDLPEPPRELWRIVGPGIVAAGIALSSGEFILWPYIASQVGLVLLWALSRLRKGSRPDLPGAPGQ